MLLQNLQFGLKRKFLDWEERFVFNEQVNLPHAYEAIEAAGAIEKGRDNSQKIDNAYKKHAEFKNTLRASVWDAAKKGWVDVRDLFNVLDTIKADFEEWGRAIDYATSLYALIENLKADLRDGDLDQDYDDVWDYEKILTDKNDLSLSVEKALQGKQKIEWIGNIQFSANILDELFNAVIENKKNPDQKDSDYLKQQFEKPNSAETKILLKGYEEIISKYEVKQSEKPLIQNQIQWLEVPYNRLSENENLKNLISRSFDVSQNQSWEIVLVDHKKTQEEIENPKEAIQKFIDQQIPEIRGLKKENSKLPEKLLAQLEQKDNLQKQSIDELRVQLKQAKEYDENSDNKMSFGDMIRSIAEWISAISSGNFDKLGAMTKWVKMEKNSSQTNQFELTYNEKEKSPKQEEIQGYMKGKTVTINTGSDMEKRIKITDPEKQIRASKGKNGKLTIEVTELTQKLDLNVTTAGQALTGELANKLNQNGSIRLGSFNENNLLLQNKDLKVKWFSIDQTGFFINGTHIGLKIWQEGKLILTVPETVKDNFDVKFDPDTNMISLKKKEIKEKWT